jgi:hypothetical protein
MPFFLPNRQRQTFHSGLEKPAESRREGRSAERSAPSARDIAQRWRRHWPWWAASRFAGRSHGGGGSESPDAWEGLFHASLRAGGVQTLGAFAVFGQLTMMQGNHTGLLKQNDEVQEGKRMRERISGAEHGLQVVPERSNKNSLPLAGSTGARSVAYGIKS